MLGPDGADLPLHLEGQGAVGTSTVLRCDAEKNTFTFTDVPVGACARQHDRNRQHSRNHAVVWKDHE